MSDTMQNGLTGFWNQHAELPDRPRKPWLGEGSADIVIVGAGFTGLWTALFLRRLVPDRSVAILEAETVGYGASGRNGGWVSSLLPGNRARFEKIAGIENTRRMQRTFIEAVDEIADEFQDLGIDAGAANGGILTVATTEAGMSRAAEKREADVYYGYQPDEVRVLSAGGFRNRINVESAVGGLETSHGMAIQPALAVHGLARAVEEAGATIFENSAVVSFEENRRRLTVRTPVGSREIEAQTILICTEGYTSPLSRRRSIAPINSSMIVTSPLSAGDWAQIGWNGRQCLNDSAHTFIYSQRTSDGRIAIGGRGSPYRFNNGTGGEGTVDRKTIHALTDRLHQFFPQLEFDVEHAWSGVLGVTRDWNGSVSFNLRTGFGASLGYAGHGVTASYVGGRTLAELVAGEDTLRTHLPWVDYRPPQWEPEPLRWLGIHAMYRLFGVADSLEERTHASRTSLLARLGGRLAGLSE
ncbi:FAD-binding oxidoreductase [Brevibacterium luteolum]|uniref:NAD(P)/FAD-dependent oxidoreductase n=1 Tax=Brevibacterium luteolum TaxID=199591 RepID=UPI00223BDAA8|nr:FAD-dependent oxidoreductase [Brevibacterium luteolum]MCT1921551.1 FAD-binding oxidoreductase [Brevibacterium luteolum]